MVVVQEETDIVVLLLAVIDSVQGQLYYIEDKQSLAIIVRHDTCCLQSLRVTRGLISVQSKSLEV
jgi:hypothetical protein